MKTNELIIEMYNLFKLSKYNDVIDVAIINIGLIVTLIGRLIENKDFTYNIFINHKHDIKNNNITKYTDIELFELFSYIILNIIQINTIFEYNEKEEFATPKFNTLYSVILADDEYKLKLFILYVLLFSFESHIREQFDDYNQYVYVGIDYEFNNRQIAVMQLNFERASSIDVKMTTYSHIWLINPSELDKPLLEIMIKYLMRNKKIYKILHGADSLDVPYMYFDLFSSDIQTIRDFTTRYIDTRFLCEYFKIHQNDGKKCSIYEALLYFNTITQDKYDYLEKTHADMGPVQDISWNIINLKNDIPSLKYALFDVLFIKRFYLDIHHKALTEAKNYYTHYHMITKLIQYVVLERRAITNTTEIIKKEVDQINNYYFFHNDIKYNLIDVFNKVMNIEFSDNTLKISHLLEITYLRTYLILIIKKIVYSYLSHKFLIIEKKGVKFDKSKIQMENYYIDLEINGFKHIIPFVKLIENHIVLAINKEFFS
jgi:hypothetical protein